jgi:hypothetical protein
MLSEKHNDHYGWKNKLEGLTGLPGEAALDKNIAWEKLHSRLQEKPRKHTAIWYWAAACLLPALIIPLMLTNKKENSVVRNDPPQKQQTIILPAPPVPVIATIPMQVEKKKVENNSKKDQHITEIKNIVKQEEPVTAITEAIIEKDPLVTITDTAATITASVPIKKKLAVVHINELASPTAQFYPLPNYVQRSFKIKFKNGRSANQTIASQQQYEGGFKIKLSPKN